MSSLPKYRPQLGEEEEEESVGLLGSDAPRPYPPPQGTASGAPRSVVYQLRPRGSAGKDLKRQDAVSIIGRDRTETVKLVLATFPELKRFDEDRLTFSMQSDPLARITSETEWARITDVAWPALQAAVIRVELAGAPGEVDRRELVFRVILGLIVVLVVAAVILLIVTIAST